MKLKTITVHFFVFFVFGCDSEYEQKLSINKIQAYDTIPNMCVLSGKWLPQPDFYWSESKNDSAGPWVKPADTWLYPDYTLNKVFCLSLKSDLTIKKTIEYDPKTMTRLSETDEYIKALSDDIESILCIGYSFKTKEYFADLIASHVTRSKRDKIEAKRASLLKAAENDGVRYCGTALHEILYKDINPFATRPREISKDSAFMLVSEWTRN